MGTVGKIARRTFLIGSAAIAGGVAFGAYAVYRTPENPLSNELEKGEASFNPWVKIDAQKITLITPHADKGQGVASMQAALIAEELDLDFGQFEISFGTPSAAYWNRAVAADAVPFMPTDQSFLAETARSSMTSFFKIMELQITGGSSSAPDSYDKLREAGAVARETLKLAAATKFNVPVGKLKTASGQVILPDGKKVKYQELAEQAAKTEPVRTVSLRPSSEWRLIGKPMERIDIRDKSTGKTKYGIDFTMDNMVYAAVRTNPRLGGEIKKFDASAAEKMRGVKKVVPVTNGVAVIADNTWRAFQAVNAIECEWGPAPYPAEQGEHWERVSNSFNDDKLDLTWRNEGDIAAALKEGTVVSAEYRSPYAAHQPLEPLNATVLVTPERVDIWTGHQIPKKAEEFVAAITGHAITDVHLHNLYVGGSFGHRLEFEVVKQAAEIARQMPDVPVKLTFSREEDFAHDFPRHIAMGRGKGTVADGKVEAIDLQIAAPSVSSSQFTRADLTIAGPDVQIVAGAWNNPYSFKNFRMRGYRVDELVPVSSWRSVGAVGAGFIFDSFLDEVIHAAGADPMEERIRMMEHDVSRKVLETVADMCSWGEKLPDGKGRGIAFVESFGVPTAEVVEVTNSEDGIKIDKVWVACDVGQIIDPINFENQVQGGVVWGLGHAMNCELTYSDGMAEQSNYDSYEAMRQYQCPEILVKGLENGDNIRGIGEPPVPPAAPALANAIFAATGKRIREMPFNKFIEFI